MPNTCIAAEMPNINRWSILSDSFMNTNQIENMPTKK